MFLLPSYFSKPAQAQRPHSTAATAKAPQTQAAQPPAVQTQSGGGMFSNILQTAAGVAIGHTVGRMISGIFDSGASAATTDNGAQITQNAPVQCQSDTKKFLDCMQQNYDDVSSCQNYLEMLKQCQRQFAQ